MSHIDDAYPYVNGTLWSGGPSSGWRRILVYFSGDKFGLMDFPCNYAGWPAVAPMFQHDGYGKWTFTLDEIKQRLDGKICLGFWYCPDWPKSVRESLSPEDFADVERVNPAAARGISEEFAT